MTLIIFLLASLVGGSGAPLIKFTVGVFSPITLVVLRALLAALFITPIVFQKRLFILKEKRMQLILANILFAANWLFFAFGIDHTTVIMGQIIYLPTAAIVAIIGYLFLKEKLTKEQIIGLILAIGGMSFLIYGSYSTGEVLSFGTPTGNFLVMLGLFSWSIYTVVSRSISNLYSPLTITFFNFVMALVLSFILLPLELANRSFPIHLTTTGILGLLSVALFNSVIFFYLYQWLVKHTSAFISSLSLYLVTVFASMAGIVFFNEKLTTNLIIGVFFIVIGVFLSTSYNYLKVKASR